MWYEIFILKRVRLNEYIVLEDIRFQWEIAGSWDTLCCCNYIPLRVCGYKAEDKLSIVVLAQRLIIYFFRFVNFIYIIMKTINFKSSSFQTMCKKKCGNRIKVRYWLNQGFVSRHVCLNIHDKTYVKQSNNNTNSYNLYDFLCSFFF